MVAHAPTVGPGGRRRWFQEPGGGPIVPMACLTLRNDHLVLELCPELKNASFETLGAKVAELGLTLDFDIAAELARIEAKKLRRSAHNTARLALRQKVYYVEFLDDDGFSELKRQCEQLNTPPQVANLELRV